MNIHTRQLLWQHQTVDRVRRYTLSTDDVVASAHSLELINIHKTPSPHTHYARPGTAGQAQNEEGGKMAASKIDSPIVISDTDWRELNES